MADRELSLTSRVRRLGFVDSARAASVLESPHLELFLADTAAVDDLALAADPDAALELLSQLVRDRVVLDLVLSDELVRRRLVNVLGVSIALGQFLIRHPEFVADLATQDPWPDTQSLTHELLNAVGADPARDEPVSTLVALPALDALRIAYRRRELLLAARDLTGEIGLDAVGRSLADLADAVLQTALAIGRAELPEGSPGTRLAVIAMGKAGARELNYVSDVDVIFVAEPVDGVAEVDSHATATKLSRSIINICATTTGEGSIWEVDAGLRPEGKAGALVRTVASHRDYYSRWAKTWEFQALLKARPSAGDVDLGNGYMAAMLPCVWSAADREGFVSDVQQMRRRVEDNVAKNESDRELKLGPGGLRDVEFAVQLLQLVHGRTDVMLRSPTTLTALEALATWGYVGRDDASTLAAAYRFERTLEHRLQLRRLRRTHLVPDDETELRVLGRSMGFRSDPVLELIDTWKKHQREVRRLHEKLFYRPLLNAVARLDPGEARLTLEAAADRLEALGYADPAGALRHLEALTTGVARRASIQRTLLPVLLGWFADTPNPDSALLGFRRVSEALGSTPWYLRLLRDESLAAQRLAMILGSSRLATDLLLRDPESVRMLAHDDELIPRDRGSLESEVLTAVARQNDPVEAMAIVLGIRRREMFRVAAADVLSLVSIEDVGWALSDISSAAVVGALQAAVMSVSRRRGEAGLSTKLPTRFAIIAMGRLGGRECGYGSDADVMFVHDPLPGAEPKDAADAAFELANEVRSLLMAPSTDPPLEIDADLRPDGKQGPLVMSFDSTAAYYGGRSAGWESQALLRAAPLAGDPELTERFMQLVKPLRYPEGGLSEAQRREVRRLKARMEAERLPRGADPTLNTKLGRGGLSDVEWAVQLIQLDHASAVEQLQVTGTLAAADAEVEAGLLHAADREVMLEAWRLAMNLRNAVMLVKGRASDSVPIDLVDAGAVARLLGFSGGSQQLLDEYRRVTRRARGVVERVFYQ